MRRRSRILLSLALAAAFAVSSAAQTKKEKKEEASARSLQGQVSDPDDKPVVGAVVQLKDMRTLQVRSFITQDDGTYHFSGLKGDIEYQLTAKAGDASAGPKTLSIFDSRKE